jgi:hypothetical protein
MLVIDQFFALIFGSESGSAPLGAAKFCGKAD